MIHFALPAAFITLAIIPVLLLRWGRAKSPAVAFSSVSSLAALRPTWRTRLRILPRVLRVLTIIALTCALARPQESSGKSQSSMEGIAIQIVLDRSGSMREPIEFNGQEITKLTLAKRVVESFVAGDGKELKGRDGDMIGLVTFARYADTTSPLSRSHDPLIEGARQLQTAQTREEDGTAIGDALALAAARLKRAEEEVSRATRPGDVKPEFTIKSKVIILMTDGQNNAGASTPYEAAELAMKWGIRIYTIGVGAGDRVQTVNGPFGDMKIPVGNGVDERMLTAIAGAAGGKYWPAENGESLIEAYREIDQLEKSRIDLSEYTQHTELFAPFAIAAACTLALEVLLACTYLRRIPA